MSEEITVAELDALAQKYADQKVDYEEKKKIASASYEEVSKIEAELLDALDRANKPNYPLPGVGTFYIGARLAVKIDNQKELFKYISQKYGEDALFGMQSINYQKINAFYKSELEAGAMVVPGLTEPVAQRFVGLRRKE